MTVGAHKLVPKEQLSRILQGASTDAYAMLSFELDCRRIQAQQGTADAVTAKVLVLVLVDSVAQIIVSNTTTSIRSSLNRSNCCMGAGVCDRDSRLPELF